jgi:alpha-amylase
MNTGSELYKTIATVNAARKSAQIWNEEYVERYVADNFFAFSKGKFLVALTNQQNNDVNNQVTYTPFSSGEQVCNVFYPTSDCQTVNNGVNVYLAKGESKIYVPKSSLEEWAVEFPELFTEQQPAEFLQ